MGNDGNRKREDKLDAGELNRERISRKIQENADGDDKYSKLSNFWYYNKWKVIISLFVVIVIIICTLQMCSNAETDCIVMYAGSYCATSEERSTMNSLLSLYLPSDFNNDGVFRAEFNMLNIYSEEQVEELNEKAKTDSDVYGVNKSTNKTELQTFDNIIMTGQYNICIMEPWLYERVAKNGGFRRLSDILGYKPENAYSEYAILLSDSAVYKENPGMFDGVTADTLLCLRTETQIGNMFKKSSGSVTYEFSVDFFKALVLGK